MRTLTAEQLEVAALVRSRSRRAFQRYVGPQLETLLAGSTAHQAEVTHQPDAEADPDVEADGV